MAGKAAAKDDSVTQPEATVPLFSYGTLRQPNVQRAAFGRLLEGRPDALPGFALSPMAITDPRAIAASGAAVHTIAGATGDPADLVPGLVFGLTAGELEAADRYEPDGVARVRVWLASGAEAFVYVSAETCYRFRPVTADDVPLLRAWRARPHVIEWWGAPDVEDAQDALADPRIAMWVVEHLGPGGPRPFAYAQDYAPRDWDDHPFAHLPPGSRGIDQYIGEPDMLGRGHGSAFVAAHCRRLFAAGAPAIGADPHPDNLRARRAYEKAGFVVASGSIETRWGRAVLMECRPSDRAGSGEAHRA